MGTFKEDYNKRLRRLCVVTNDTLRVETDSETVYERYCETCTYEYEAIVVKVYNEDGSVRASNQFYGMGELLRSMDQVEL